MVQQDDAAYGFVQAANKKEAARKAARDSRKPPSSALSIGAMLLLWGVACMNFVDGQIGSGFLFIGLSLTNAWTAYYNWGANAARPEMDS